MDTRTWRDIRARHASGEAIKSIARTVGVSRNTVRRALGSDGPPTRRPPVSVTDGHDRAVADLLAAEPDIPATEIARRIDWPHSMTALKERVRALRGQALVPTRDDRPELTSFVGRDDEIAAIVHAVRRHRLVTLAGPGGVGKSRLAQRAASACSGSFPDGVRTVELAAVRDPGLVVQAVVDGLGIPDGDTTDVSVGNGSIDTAVDAALRTVIAHLAGRSVLLVLDNGEHLVDALAAALHPLLRAVHHTCVLLTTREPLGIAGEHVLPVAPLAVPESVPETAEAALGHPAIALFADRAVDVLPGFALDATTLTDVVELCRRLDGVPLAIELAAVRLRVLSVRQLLIRLTDRFAVLTDGDRAGPVRHRTLLATVAWSHELCTATEQALWSHATVFPASFDLDSLDAVCARDAGFEQGVPRDTLLDAVSGLTSKSILIREDGTGEVRFRMLETIREFGRERLDDATGRVLRARHLALRLAAHRDLAHGWYGPGQVERARRSSVEHADLRTALDHALGEGADASAAVTLVGSPWFLWAACLSMTEHRRWLHRALEAWVEPTAERAEALVTAALVACLQGDPAAAALADDGGRIASVVDAPGCAAFAVHVSGLVAFFNDDYPTAARHFSDAEHRYRTTGSGPGHLAALDVHVGLLEISRGNLDVAERRLGQRFERSGAAGESWFRSYSADGLGFVALLRDDVASARGYARHGLELISRFDDAIGLSLALDLTAWTAAADGQDERSAVLLGAASARWGSFGRQLYGSADWQARRRSYQDRARDSLGTNRFDTAFRHGGAMTRADVLAYAVDPVRASVLPPEVELSGREREIVELVADGRTNREIAASLVLSHRTVEGHVSRVLAKLGFSRRTQLATWLERNRAHGRSR